jgi:uridylate kinase
MDDIPLYKRIVFKLSGENLKGEQSFGIDPLILKKIAQEIKKTIHTNIQIGIVMGGGNIIRGDRLDSQIIQRVSADHMGMLGTIINSIALRDALESMGIDAVIQSAVPVESIARPYRQKDALTFLNQGKVVLFAAGTGNPYFSTDTAAALRAIEIKADILLKGTMVDGVYSADPKKNPNAFKYETIHYDEIISKNLRILDMTAIALCRENNLKIRVFNVSEPNSLFKAISDNKFGTLIQ